VKLDDFVRQFCSIADCFEEAEAHGLCSTHRKREARGQSVTAPLRAPTYDSPFHRAHEAAMALADAPTDDDAEYRRREDRFRKALDAYAAWKTRGRRRR
jgi:hypothetical protein